MHLRVCRFMRVLKSCTKHKLRQRHMRAVGHVPRRGPWSMSATLPRLSDGSGLACTSLQHMRRAEHMHSIHAEGLWGRGHASQRTCTIL